jgi:protein gp37
LADLGPLDLSGIDWVIVGGESGPYARPMLRNWVVNIRRQCRAQRVPFFFKQWGGTRSTRPAARSTAAPTMSFRSPSIAFSQRSSR